MQELTEGFQWNHVPSVLNPADLVSRGLRPCDLPNLRLWWHGPQFLEKGKLLSEETSLSPVKECDYSKELKTGSSSDIITSSVCVSTNCVSSILSTLLRKNIDQAETKLIRMVQEQVVFLAEIKSLQSKGVVSPNSKLRNLNPFIDSDGLLRVGGRLSNSDLPYVNKHPAILPGNHNLTVQIIVYFHRKNLHTGASSLLHYLMGNLPRDRVVPDYPFNCSAIQIEIVSDLTSDAFIPTLKRFFSRKDDNLAGFLSAEGIELTFIPPRAPSFGGLWEASVKSINCHLRRVVSGSNLTYEEFLTVCIQIERILNYRPLCPLSSNSDDLNALTPAHFLIGRSMTSVIEPNLIELKECP
ncbi:integrase catalytic domain-containing protein [Trichonephila clavipes]|nr:integrase catalytic domain-containing protein [Trichonephila clavipes]